MISAILFISFFIFLILGVPIGICLGLSSVCAILYSGTSLTIVATNMYAGISKFLLLAIPFFVLSGNIMAKAGISQAHPSQICSWQVSYQVFLWAWHW